MMITKVQVLGDKDTQYEIEPIIDAEVGVYLKCSCPAFEYSSEPLGVRACKHIKFLRTTFAARGDES